MIDHEHFDRPPLGVELQPELLLHGSEYRWTIRVDLDAVHTDPLICRHPRRPRRQLIGGPFQIEIVMAAQSRAIDDASLHELHERTGQVGQRKPRACQLAKPDSDTAKRSLPRFRRRRRRPRAAGRIDSRTIERRGSQLWTQPAIGPSDDKRIHRQLARFAMNRQFEPLFEQRLKHQLSRADLATRHGRRKFTVGLGRNVIPRRQNPVGRTNELKFLEAIRTSNNHHQRRIHRRGAPPRLDVDADLVVARGVWPHGRHFELWPFG